MSNKKDFATSTVLTAPSPADSGTSLVVQSGHGARFPAAPFYITVHPPSEFPTLDNAEKILVTDKSTDTFTITRAQGDTTAKAIEAGWRISNSLFLDDITGKVDGPASSTDNAIARYDGTTGELLQSSTATIDDTGTIIIGATNDLYLSSNGSVTSFGPVSTAVFNTLKADNIIERNTGVGITVDGVLIKDGLVDGKDVSTLTSNTGDVTLNGTQTLTNKTISGSSNTLSDIVATASLTATGTKSSSTYLRGDDTWATPPNTTYSEISTADIDAGTSATSRTITGRRAKYIQDKTLERVYPVGSIYISTVSTNPNTLFGFGTWVAYGEGRVIVGKAASGTFATAGATGGAETHTLTSSEVPATPIINNADSNAPQKTNGVYGFAVGSTGNMYYSLSGGNGLKVNGGGGAHNNLQPYIVAYMWQRTA